MIGRARESAPAPRRGTTEEGGSSSAGNGLDGGRQGDAGGAQGEAGGGPRRRAEAEAGTVLLDFGFGERIEIGQDRRPRSGLAETGDAVIEGAFEEQGEERAEDVAADGLVKLVEIGRVAKRCLAARKAASTLQSCL